MSVVLAAAGGSLPPPVVEVLTRPEVITAMVGVVVAILGAIATGFVALGKHVGHRLDAVETNSQIAADQVTHNHGSSMRDEQSRIAAQVQDVAASQSEVAATVRALVATVDGMAEVQRSQGHQLGEIKHDLTDERADRRQDADAITQLRDQSTEEHARIWRALDSCPAHSRTDTAH